MPGRARLRWLVIVIGLAATAALYTYGLDRGPAYVGGDEAHFVSHAHAIAQTGRDLNGTRFPLFIKITDLLVPNHSSRIWYQPALFYLLALDLYFFPVNEWSARLPTTLIAVLNVWLVYLVGRRLFTSRVAAAGGAVMLALTPAHFIVSRQALDYICPLPVVLGWMLCVLDYQRTRRPAFLYAGSLLLAMGVFTYISSWLLMPFLAVLTAFLARPPWPVALKASTAFALPAVALAVWSWANPEMLRDTVTRYRIAGDAPAANAPWYETFNLSERITIYWDYFNPSFLFLAGGSNPTMATARVGVFLLPVAALLVVGVLVLARQRSRTAALLLAVFFIAPLPIAIAMPEAPEYTIGRSLLMLPLGALIAAAGVEWLWLRRARIARAAAVGLLLMAPLQFATFLDDYYGDYQRRATPRLDPVAMRDVLPAIDALDRSHAAPAILFSDDLDDKSVRWRFYTLKAGRHDLWGKARYFNPERVDAPVIDAGALLILYAADPRIDTLLATGACVRAEDVSGINGEPAATILRWTGPAARSQ